MRKPVYIFLLFIALVASWGAPARADSSPTAVVKRFYDAWAKVSTADPYVPGSEEKCLEAHRDCFEPGLYALIMKTWALEKGGQEIEGYDCDPFFWAQTAFVSPRMGKVVVAGGVVKVMVYARETRGKGPVGPERLCATAVVRCVKGTWVITDILSPGPGSKDSPASLRAFSEMLLAEHAKRAKKP